VKAGRKSEKKTLAAYQPAEDEDRKPEGYDVSSETENQAKTWAKSRPKARGVKVGKGVMDEMAAMKKKANNVGQRNIEAAA